ncbi:hypothetical protein INR49_005101 [Caranx melampygus]|nr:hypothetical protein INR49_005101 [Caranx melampygus]
MTARRPRERHIQSQLSPTSFPLDGTVRVAFLRLSRQTASRGTRFISTVEAVAEEQLVTCRARERERVKKKMDVGESQQKMISLLIKTPNQAREDQVVEGIHLDWTVNDLKMYLSTVYPTKPTDSTPTLHLVCAFRNPPQGSLGARPKTVQTEPRPMAASASPSPSGSPTPRIPAHQS